MCTKCTALNWFQWIVTQCPVITWEAFKIALLSRFSSTQNENPHEQVMALKQMRIVGEYKAQFITLVMLFKNI